MTLTLPELERKEHLLPEDVDRFLDENSFPLVDGTRVTFAFRGPADEVKVRHWIYGLSSSQPLARLAGSDLWLHTMELPERSRVEYKLEVVHHGQARLIQDPLNPHLAHDPYGANSVVHAAGYEIPEWTLPDPEARPGTLEQLSFTSDVLGETRPLTVYLPARFRQTRRYPLLVVHDGSDFLRFTGLQTILDNLIHRLEIPPMVVAMVDSPRRLTEYANDERHARFLTEELVPLLEERHPLLPSPAARGLLGASVRRDRGALHGLAQSGHVREPDVALRLLRLHGHRRARRGPAFDPVVEFVNTFRDAPGRPAERLFMACGTYEPMIYYNRSMVPLLQATGMDVRWEEARDGHNWENWRDRLRTGLSWLFPGPLWMVYE